MTRWDLLFRIELDLDRKLLVIEGYDANHTDPRTGHQRIDVEVVHGDEEIFARGEIYCAVNRWTAIDGVAAKELAVSLVAMKPGDTDPDYFAGYTPRQLEWATRYGEELSVEREALYCDEDGNVRSESEVG